MFKYHHSYLILLALLIFALPASAMIKETPQEHKQRIARKGPPPIPPKKHPFRPGQGVGTANKAAPPINHRGRKLSENSRFSRRIQLTQKIETSKSKLPDEFDHTTLSQLLESSKTVRAPIKIRAGKNAVMELKRLKASSSPKVLALSSGVKVTVKYGLDQLKSAMEKHPDKKFTARKQKIREHHYAGSTANSEGGKAKGALVEYILFTGEDPFMTTIKKVMPKDEGFEEIEQQVQATLTLSITIKE